jgi:hypothetical protein
MIRACDQQVSELKKMPLDDVTQTVEPTESQHKALEQIQSEALDTAETLAATCPKALPRALNEQLAILSHTLEAMATSLGALRPTFATFYGLLDDEQKARLVAMGVSNNARPRSEQDRRATGRQNIDKRSGSNQGSFCQQWVIDLRSWSSGRSRMERLYPTNNAPRCMILLQQFIGRLVDWGRLVIPTIVSLRPVVLKPDKSNWRLCGKGSTLFGQFSLGSRVS